MSGGNNPGRILYMDVEMPYQRLGANRETRRHTMSSRRWFGIVMLGLLTGSLVLGLAPVEKAASLKGIVTDPGGSPLPQVTVVLTNLNTRVRLTALTGRKGEL